MSLMDFRHLSGDPTQEDLELAAKFQRLLEPFKGCEEHTPETKAVVRRWVKTYQDQNAERPVK